MIYDQRVRGLWECLTGFTTGANQPIPTQWSAERFGGSVACPPPREMGRNRGDQVMLARKIDFVWRYYWQSSELGSCSYQAGMLSEGTSLMKMLCSASWDKTACSMVSKDSRRVHNGVLSLVLLVGASESGKRCNSDMHRRIAGGYMACFMSDDVEPRCFSCCVL